MRIKKLKKEFVLVTGVLTISCLVLLGQKILSKSGQKVEISVDGNVVQTLYLNEDQEILIHGFHEGTNRIIIKDKKVCVTEASCPDKTCVHKGWIEHTGENVVCLPNRMIAQIIEE